MISATCQSNDVILPPSLTSFLVVMSRDLSTRPRVPQSRGRLLACDWSPSSHVTWPVPVSHSHVVDCWRVIGRDSRLSSNILQQFMELVSSSAPYEEQRDPGREQPVRIAMLQPLCVSHRWCTVPPSPPRGEGVGGGCTAGGGWRWRWLTRFPLRVFDDG